MDSEGLGLVLQCQSEAAGVGLRSGIVGSIGKRLELCSGTDIDNRPFDASRLHPLEEDAGQMRNGQHIGLNDVLSVFLAPF